MINLTIVGHFLMRFTRIHAVWVIACFILRSCLILDRLITESILGMTTAGHGCFGQGGTRPQIDE
jgi:hypothetical protein